MNSLESFYLVRRKGFLLGRHLTQNEGIKGTTFFQELLETFNGFLGSFDKIIN